MLQSLIPLQVQDGSKIMLMATSGPTLGQAAAEKLAKEKAEAAKRKAERDAATKERAAARQERQAAKANADLMQVTTNTFCEATEFWHADQFVTKADTCYNVQERSMLWAKTGIVALRDAGLRELPFQVSQAGPAVQVVDIGGNRLHSIHSEFGALTTLQKLRLSHNLLQNSGLPEGLFSAFPQLQILAMAHNRHVFPPPISPGIHDKHDNISITRSSKLNGLIASCIMHLFW